MDWFLLMLCTGLLLSIIASPKKGPLSLLFAADDDIKIAPNNLSDVFRQSGSAGEEAADAYQRHCQNGNVERAREVGAALADLLLSVQCVDSVQCTQSKILFAYVADKYTENYSPDSIIAQAVISSFQNALAARVPDVLESITDDAAFSLYILSDRGTRNQTPGQVFASLCAEPDNTELAAQGQHLYHEYLAQCKEAFDRVTFH